MGAKIDRVLASAHRVPASGRECDGTLCWEATELVLVQVSAGGVTGIGFSYTQGRPAAVLVRDRLAGCVLGEDAFDLPRLWRRMNDALRNAGRPGLGMMALSAVDIALWDLKARLLGLPLAALWGQARKCVPVYGSGGFTTLDDAELQAQLAGWVKAGMRAVKIKVGSDPGRDPERVRLARETAGEDVALMVDANGACDSAQALELAAHFAEARVCWFEEPLSSDDLDGLSRLRQRIPPGMAIAAGEYGWDANYFRRMLAAGAVDVLQADATRCGYTGFLQAATLCEAFHCPLSAHCAPALHTAVACAVPGLRHIEYFHDHACLERRLFEHVPEPHDGALRPDPDLPGHGLQTRPREIESHAL